MNTKDAELTVCRILTGAPSRCYPEHTAQREEDARELYTYIQEQWKTPDFRGIPLPKGCLFVHTLSPNNGLQCMSCTSPLSPEHYAINHFEVCGECYPDILEVMNRWNVTIGIDRQITYGDVN